MTINFIIDIVVGSTLLIGGLIIGFSFGWLGGMWKMAARNTEKRSELCDKCKANWYSK